MDIPTPRHSGLNSTLHSTLDETEVAHFSALAHQWWDEAGPYKILHEINPVRIDFIRQSLGLASFAGLRILDIGCGGGLVSEPLARLGAHVTAIDASEENIAVAKAHAAAHGLTIAYHQGGPESLLADGKTFDLVLAMEVIEHVSDPAAFMDACAALTSPEGHLVMCTLNQTVASYLLGIVAAENVLGWVPKGTHQWRKFVRPRVLQKWLLERGFEGQSFKGMSYHILKNKWSLSDDLSVNYFVCAYRQKMGKKGIKHLVGELSSWG